MQHTQAHTHTHTHTHTHMHACILCTQDDREGSALPDHLKGHTRLTRGKAAQQGIVVDNIADSNETLIAGRTNFGTKKDEGGTEEPDEVFDKVCMYVCIDCACMYACMYVFTRVDEIWGYTYAHVYVAYRRPRANL